MSADNSLDLKEKAILVVDDVKMMREVLKLSLSEVGANNFMEAPDAKRALNLVKQWQIELILLDWEMQPVSGIDFLKTLRRDEDPRIRQTPVIMVTSSTEVKRIIEARDHGIDGYLVKPVSPLKLQQALEKVLLHRRPFVESPGYIGPCRRTRNDPNYKGKERRESPPPPIP